MEKVLLKTIAKQVRGVSYKPNELGKENIEGYIPLLRAGNIGTTTVSNLDDLVFVSEKNVSKQQYLQEGDILMATSSGSIDIVGKSTYIDKNKDFTFGAFCKVIRPNKDLVNPKYVSHFFQTNYYRKKISTLAQGANINNLKKEHIDNLEIPLPDIDSQNKIVAILDKAKTILDKREETIRKYDELQRAIFIEMFGDPVKNDKGWEQVKLIDICTKITDGTHKTPNYLSKGVKFISAKNIKKNSISWIDVKYISEAESNLINSRCNPEFDDILLTKSGSLGQPALVDADFKFTLFESLALIKYDRNKVTPPFLITYLMSNGVAYFYRQRHKGVAIKHLHLVDIKSIPVYLPPIELQNEFGKKYYKIKDIKNKLEISILKLNLIKDALSQLAFKGELDFNTAVDLEMLLENDYTFFKTNSSQETIRLLLERLDKDELNSNKFFEPRLYDKAKEFVFELLKENKVKQIFDENSKRIKLTI